MLSADSVMFIEEYGDPPIEVGAYLGDLTDEVVSTMKEEGSRAVSACFFGPKTYFIKMEAPSGRIQYSIKAKGITLTQDALKVVSPHKMRSMVQNFCENAQRDQVRVPQFVFETEKGSQNVYTRDSSKLLQVTTDKRIVIGNDTMAIGYCRTE